ncbi:MAG: SDR family oxidoreductase [Deltaproteobacteria bacterium]|nr:SDR family oxidoreductase [Deltaproteobacteria bacterium]
MASFDLSGKRALVTGGSRGIGRAIAVGLARAGADVAVTSRSADRCEEAASEIRALGRASHGIGCDVAKGEDVVRLFEELAKRDFGPLDSVVTCAGTAGMQPSLMLERQDMQLMLDVHVHGSFDVARRAALQMQGRGGSIVFCSSVWGIGSQRMAAAYGAAKAAICSLTRTLAVEWAPLKIRVNAVAPGLIETDMTAPLLDDPGMRDKMLKSVPLRRAGSPDEIAGAAVFLCSSAASYVTGHTLVIDGGVRAR